MTTRSHYKIVLNSSTINQPIGEHRVNLQPLEEARELAKTLTGVNGLKPDYFEIQTEAGAVLERWARTGDAWRRQYA